MLAPFTDEQLGRLRERMTVAYESWMETRRLQDPDQLAARLRDDGTHVLVVESDFVFEEAFTGASSLRFVGICRAATHQIDIEAATQHGVLVVNTPARNAQAVAEHALGLMLALARQVPQADRYVKDGRWDNPVEPYLSMRGVELAGRTLGIIGLGAVGRKTAALTQAFGMTCLAYDPYVDEPPDDVRMVELDDLLAASDVVAIHAPATPETAGLLDARRIGLMPSTAYIVNLSDASIVGEEALVDALREKRIAGVAMDVFETQPVAPNSPLLTLDNVVLTPHIGGATAETIERHSTMMTDDILRFLDGEQPRNLVNAEAWDRRG